MQSPSPRPSQPIPSSRQRRSPRILVFPGMGGTADMFRGPWRQLPNTSFLDFPTDYVPENIPALADYFAERCQARPDYLIGCSFGGMVALELSKRLRPRRVILISSSHRGADVNPFVLGLRPIGHLLPFALSHRIAQHVDHRLPRMYAANNPAFIRAMCLAIPSWHYNGKVPFTHIHGRYDKIIIPRSADYWLAGGHLISITQPLRCVQHILTLLTSERS